MGRLQTASIAAALVGLAACGGTAPAIDRDASAPTSDGGVEWGADAGEDATSGDGGDGSDAGDAGDGGVAPDAGWPGVGAGTSFRITAHLVYAPGAPAELPTTLAATLWAADGAGGALELVSGADGVAQRASATRDADGAWSNTWSWRPVEPLGSCARVADASLHARVVLVDDDGDGLADRLTGAGDGRLQHIVTDFTEDYAPFTATLDGTVEHDPPTLRWVGWVAGHVPVAGADAPLLVASEPLTAPADAWLEAPDGRRIPLAAFGTDADPPTLLAGWSLWPSEPLPFDVDLVLRTTDVVDDLTGLPLATPPPLATLPIASAVVNEGFEPGSGAHLEGSASITPSLGTLAPIAGARSALVPPTDPDGRNGSVVTARLAVPVGATAVHLRARYLSRAAASPYWSWGTPMVHVRVVPTTGDETRVWTGPAASVQVPTGDATWPAASEVVDVVIPLPATAAGEVAVVVGDDYGCAGMVPTIPTSAMWIDDVRAE